MRIATTTILKVARDAGEGGSLARALSEAGVEVVEVADWAEARGRLEACGTALLVCDLEADPVRVARALSSLDDGAQVEAPRDPLRTLSHDLRTPLSAMAGWLHLMESGRLDEAGMKRAIEKLKGNIEDQVRMLERHLGASTKEGHG